MIGHVPEQFALHAVAVRPTIYTMSRNRNWKSSGGYEISWGRTWLSPSQGAGQKQPAKTAHYQTEQAKLARAKTDQTDDACAVSTFQLAARAWGL